MVAAVLRNVLKEAYVVLLFEQEKALGAVCGNLELSKSTATIRSD